MHIPFIPSLVIIAHLLAVGSGHEVDVLLPVLHALDVVGQRGLLLLVIRGVEAQQLGQPAAVGSVLEHSQLDAGAVLLPERLVVLVTQLLQHVDDLADQLLLDDLEELVLLQVLSADVQGQIVRVDDTADEAQVAGDHVLEVVGDEDAAHVQPDVLSLGAVVPQHVRGRHTRHVQQRLERYLSLSDEVRLAQGALGVLGERLVELFILGVLDISRLLGPDGLGVVLLHPVPGGLGDLLGLGLVLLFLLDLDVAVL